MFTTCSRPLDQFHHLSGSGWLHSPFDAMAAKIDRQASGTTINLFIYLDANMAENWFLQMLNVFKCIDHNNVK